MNFSVLSCASHEFFVIRLLFVLGYRDMRPLMRARSARSDGFVVDKFRGSHDFIRLESYVDLSYGDVRVIRF